MNISPEWQFVLVEGLMLSVGIYLIVMAYDAISDKYVGTLERLFFGGIFLAGGVYFLGFDLYIAVNYLASLHPKF